MNKKGSHVDWVISMGIFITYIFALFILLRPGVTPVYRPVTLLDNLQEQFEDNVTWTVKFVPLFVRICREGSEGQTTIEVDDANNFWKISKAVKNEETINHPIICVAEVTHSNSEIILYLVQKPPYDLKNYPNLILECRPEDENYCRAELGVIEDIEGINPDKLNLIANKIYKDLKSEWKVPADKDFAIFVDDLSGGERDKIIGAEPYDQANVFVRRIDTQKVYPDGTTDGIAVYLQIW